VSTIKVKDGAEIYYKDWGAKNAQPIVFHHGWPLSADDWDTQMLYFVETGCRVVAHDRRGYDRDVDRVTRCRVRRRSDSGPRHSEWPGNIDPESHLNEVCNVGVQDGHIAAVTRTPLSGRRTVDAKGLVVAPGFIDWHAHGQNALADRVQAFDGVTTTQASCPMATV
jgi:hypothetical protein